MPQFAYKARKRTGELVQDVMEAADRSAALIQIERLGLFPIMVDTPKGAAASEDSRKGSGAMGGLMPAALRDVFNRKRRPKLQELATYTQQMANLLKSGMPLTVALNSMTYLETKGIPSDISKGLRQEVMEGSSLSDAMRRQPRVFTDLHISMVKAGEHSGALVEVLQRLADHYTRFADVQSKFVSAMIYPTIVAGVGLIIIIFFMTFMLPKFMQIFDGLRVPLPWATRILRDMSQFFSSPFNWFVMGMVVVALTILWIRFKATTEGRRRIDQFKMRAPVLGKVVRLNMFGQFARTLSTLLTNGVPVLSALKITEEIIPNTVVKAAISLTREEVTDGKTLAQPLGRSKLFPQLMIDLLKIGEETGDVPGALANIAETYENELTTQLRVMTNLIEPALIIVMAVMVGGLLFSILSAMFAITSSLNR